MGREFHVRFREGLGVQFPRATRLVVFCASQEDACRVRDKLLPPWLAERGLALSEGKTRIAHLTEGFDFLGFTVRHYHEPETTRAGFKLLITPSKKAVARKRQELRALWLGLKGHSVPAVLRKLNPIIRGWAGYYRTVVAAKVFERMDAWVFPRAKRSAMHTHPKKPWGWRKDRYGGRLNQERQDHWVFGDKHSGAYRLKFSWFKIVRHVMARGKASPDDPSLRDYWGTRRKVNIRHLSDRDVKLAEAQDWTCPVCGMHLRKNEELHRHHKQPRGKGGTDALGNLELVHRDCHQQRHAGSQRERRPSADDGPGGC
jgi:RNA-directed DNA polymerase